MKSVKTFILYGVVFYLICLMALFAFQKNLIFHPEKLEQDYEFNLEETAEELFLKTSDGETINALFYPGEKKEVVLYFHGNAGSLNGWQYVAQDFTTRGYNFLIIDYRSYGKSTGDITEEGLYTDSKTAFDYLVKDKGFEPGNVIIYGRSIGTGVAVELASKEQSKGLVLESAFSSLKKLANQKMPFFLPSLLLEFHFDSMSKLKSITCPILFIHGSDDTLIPPTHTDALYSKFTGKKKKVIVPHAGHNDLSNFAEYHAVLEEALQRFF